MTDETDKTGSLAARAFWLMFAKTVAFVFSFALPLLLVRRLSQTEFGLFKQAFLVVGTAVSVLPLGFSMSVFYFLPREEGERRAQIIFNILLFNFTVGLGAFLALLLYPQLLGLIFNGTELLAYAPLIGLVILLWLSSYFLESVAVANHESRLATLFIVSAQLTKTALLFAAALLFGTVRALIYAAIVQGVVQNAVLLLYLRARFGRIWGRFDFGMLRMQLSYALPIGLAGLLYVALTDMHNYFVSNRFGPAAYALYSIGCFSLPLVGIITESVNTILISRVSYLQKQGATREIVLLMAGVMRKMAAVYFPLYVFLLVMGREIITLLFTERYLGSWPIFAINLTTLPFLIFIVDPIMRAHAEHRFFLLKVRSVVVVVLFAALWYGTRHFGLVGAISIMVGISLADRLIEAAKGWSIVGVRGGDVALLRDVWKVAAAAAVAGLVALAVRAGLVGATRPFGAILLVGCVYGVSYLAAILLLGVVTPEERALLWQQLDRLQQRRPWKRAANPLT